jgi:dihydropteroate synthase
MSTLPKNSAATLICGRFVLSLDKPLVMGIVNVTPDSFQAEGRFDDVSEAISHAHRLISEGADILDIGAESTRPGAAPISSGEEFSRLLPVLKALVALDIPISVDTRHADVMRKVIELGIDMINDVSGFRSPESKSAVLMRQSPHPVGLCAMHMKGEPLTMQDAPAYRSVVAEVQEFFYLTYSGLVEVGVAPERMVFDPGIGFGTTVEHNVQLIQQLKNLVSGLPFPVATLVGLSRKSLIGALTGKAPTDRLVGSVMGAVAAVQQGANIVRVHDVSATVDALKVWQALTHSMDDACKLE